MKNMVSGRFLVTFFSVWLCAALFPGSAKTHSTTDRTCKFNQPLSVRCVSKLPGSKSIAVAVVVVAFAANNNRVMGKKSIQCIQSRSSQSILLTGHLPLFSKSLLT